VKVYLGEHDAVEGKKKERKKEKKRKTTKSV
jgi:hypothetical protein